MTKKERDRKHRRKKKSVVMKHYSKSDNPYCKLCGFSDMRALTIDHINNDGHEHRKIIGRASHALYKWLVKQGFPPGFQVLCFNCQMIKRYGDKNYVEDSVNTKHRIEKNSCSPDINTAKT